MYIYANSEQSLEGGDRAPKAASSVAGIYKYDYKEDTENLPEDHYIILEMNNASLAGRYYGISDDCDEAREGYYPGFFVSDMQDS